MFSMVYHLTGHTSVDENIFSGNKDVALGSDVKNKRGKYVKINL